jgi:ribosomal 50S subunit-recycling heat shock protein
VKKLLIEEERSIAKNLLQQLAVYATGAPMRFSDRVEVNQILDRLAKDHYPVKSIITEIVTSHLFLSK